MRQNGFGTEGCLLENVQGFGNVYPAKSSRGNRPTLVESECRSDGVTRSIRNIEHVKITHA